MTYNADSIKKLTEKEKIQKNIGMYIWDNSYKWVLQLVYEVLSNSIDEYLWGYANQIDINLKPNGAISIKDNGRGIPVGYKEKGKSKIEEILEITHMGWKFNNQEWGWYTYSWWKHWVWTTVVNYLSSYMIVEVEREWKKYRLKYKNWDLEEKTHIVKENLSSSQTSTYIEFLPSKEFLNYDEIKYKDVYALCFRQIFLTKWLTINLKQIWDNNKIINENTLYNDKWLYSYIEYKLKLEDSIKPIWNPIFLDKEIKLDNRWNSIMIDFAFQYTTLNTYNFVWYTNNIYQSDWWKHINALKDLIYTWIVEALKRADKKLPKWYIKDDVLLGIIWIISVKINNPILEWQTKNKLNSNINLWDLKEFVINKFLADTKWLDKILELIKVRTSNRKAIEKLENIKIKRVKDPSLDPDNKLIDAETKDREKAEIFLVEWDSAGGGIKKSRNPQIQAIYPLKGKPLNIIKGWVKKTLANKELKNLIIALWTWIGKDFNISKLRYWKIFILSDADSDGYHIQSLLISFFNKVMPWLLNTGKVYRVIPPLYGIKTKKNKTFYVKDKVEKEKVEKELKRKWEKDLQIIRFKWLWEMDSDVLYDTCINPKNRITEKITNEENKENFEFIEKIMWDDSKFKYDFLKTYTPKEVEVRAKKISKEIKPVVEEAMYDYGMYINTDRAISSLEDWLKPVHKRILYAMKTKGRNSWWKTIKSARVVGETIWTYHPHWDMAVYWASVKLAQDFYLNYPLIFSQWNFWSVFWWWNDYASSRYTEMKLSKYSEDILLDKLSVWKQIVKFRPNYDWTLQEPEYLPAKIPNVLIVPTFWMWLGISASIPPHNLSEVCDAMITILKDKKANVYDYIKWPDFPMLYNEIIATKEDIQNFYEWKKSLTYRVKIDFDKKTNELVIKSLPYWVAFDNIFNKIKELVKGEKITTKKWKTVKETLEFSRSLKNEVKKIRNLSWWTWDKRKNKDEYIEIRLKLAPKANPEIVKAKLYKNTELQKTLSYSWILIDRFNQIDFYTPADIINKFIKFRKETLIKYFKIYLEDLNKNLLIAETNLIAINNIDYIVKVIQNWENEKDIIKKLMEKLDINNTQALQILDTKLRNIKKLDKKQIQDKINKIKKEISKIEKLISNDKYLVKYIIKETELIKNKYWEKRKTDIISEVKEVKIDSTKMEYSDKEVYIFITNDNHIYKTSWKQNKIDNRINMIKEKYTSFQYIVSNNRSKIYFIQNWKWYFFNVWDIKEDVFTPVSFYNNKIDNTKNITISFTNDINYISKDVLFILENGNISRVKVKDIIKTTQWFNISKKNILKGFVMSIRNKDIIMREYIDEKKWNSKYIAFNQVEDFPIKKSVWWWIKVRWNTLNIIKLNIDKDWNILNSDKISNNEILNIKIVDDLKITKRTGVGIKIQ